MTHRWTVTAVMATAALAGGLSLYARQNDRPAPKAKAPPAPHDAVAEAQTPRAVGAVRPEQRKSEHDTSDTFKPNTPAPINPALTDQPDQGRMLGFDVARDPLNAKRPMQTAEEIVKEDIAAKPVVMAKQRQLLEARYTLTPRLDPAAKMSRVEPLPVGPTARVKAGSDFDKLAAMAPADV
jgi:hypothetical protein